MNVFKISLAAFAFSIALGQPAAQAHGNRAAYVSPQATTTLTVDPAKSEVNWHATKVGGEHKGTVKLANGSLQVDGKKLKGGSFVMDMTSLVDTDKETPNARLTGHLRSEDFFSVEKHPTSTFTIIKAVAIGKAKAGEPNYTVTGDLTIKGITHPISFPATVTIAGNKAEAAAKITVNRLKYDIQYRSSFLGTAADKIIYDDFTIDVKLVAGQMKAVVGS